MVSRDEGQPTSCEADGLTLIGQQSLQALRPSQHLLLGRPEEQIKCTLVKLKKHLKYCGPSDPGGPGPASPGSDPVEAPFYLLFLRAFSKLFQCTPALIF